MAFVAPATARVSCVTDPCAADFVWVAGARAGGVQLTITDVHEPLAAPPALSAAAAAASRIQAHPKAQAGVARKAAKDAKQAELAARLRRRRRSARGVRRRRARS